LKIAYTINLLLATNLISWLSSQLALIAKHRIEPVVKLQAIAGGKMPKVTKKDASSALAAAPQQMDTDAEALPVKPSFEALSAQEQSGNKVEFRRVRRAFSVLLNTSSAKLSASIPFQRMYLLLTVDRLLHRLWFHSTA
jgi:hypothetical protein